MSQITKKNCSWCQKTDQCDEDEFCNCCEFCEANICCDCWDKDYTCYYPGEGYCPKCKEFIFKCSKCSKCVLYMDGLMSEPDMPRCDIHWDKNSPSYIGYIGTKNLNQ